METVEKDRIASAKQSLLSDNTDISAVTLGAGKGYLFVKRMLDITVAVAACAVLLVPMMVIAVLIRLDTQGPAIFTQKRMGKGGKTFTIYKFRTMAVDAPSDVATRNLTDSDRFISRFGAFLRRSSIDELPQLFNILRGDMSLVGYRPVCLTEDDLNDLRMRYGVFAVRPGLTGLAQVKGRDNLDYREKAKVDAEYVAGCSLKMDLWCLIMTVKTVLTGEGVA